MNKQIFLLGALLMLIAFTGCDGDINDFDPNKSPITGVIDGEEWSYAGGNGQYNAFNDDVTGMFYPQTVQDPCGVRATSNPHISIKFPAFRENYNIPTYNNRAYVIFNTQDGAKRLTAASGFIEIVAINGTEAIGFVSANFDDDNYIEGTFALNICN